MHRLYLRLSVQPNTCAYMRMYVRTYTCVFHETLSTSSLVLHRSDAYSVSRWPKLIKIQCSSLAYC